MIGPAVVLAGLGMVQLVPAARAVLHRPELARLRIERGALHVAMPVGPYLGSGVRSAEERVVARHRAVRIDPHDLAHAGREILCSVAIGEPIALRDEQGAVAGEDETGAEVVSSVHLRLLLVDHADVLQASGAESPPRDRGSGGAAGPRLRVGEVDPAVLGEAGIDHHVEQAALASRRHLRHAPEGIGQSTVSSDAAEPPAALGHEHAAVGQEGQPPRMVEPPRDRLGTDDAVDGRRRR